MSLTDDAYDLYQDILAAGQFSFNTLEKQLFEHFAPELIYFSLKDQLNNFQVDTKKDLNFEIAWLWKLERHLNLCISGNLLTQHSQITEIELYDALVRGLSESLSNALTTSQHEYQSILKARVYLN
jgi:hypothetical protein